MTPGQPSGILILRFFSELNYSGVLHAISNAFQQQGKNLEDLRFICVSENYQPFAIAYCPDSRRDSAEFIELDILTWGKDNLRIRISQSQEIPENLFHKSNTTKADDSSNSNEFNVGEENTKSNTIKYDSDNSKELLRKIENIGKKLGSIEKILIGITTGYNKAFVIDENTREKLIKQDPNSRNLISRLPEPNGKWRCSSNYLLNILSSKIQKWPWSNILDESQAFMVFSKTYPAVCAHLEKHRYQLKTRARVHQGEYYWELAPRQLNEMTHRPKIIYRALANSMSASYDIHAGYPLSSLFFIPTSDLSLLAILNSSVFDWYANLRFTVSYTPQLSFKKKNMIQFPIPVRTEPDKAELTDYVEIIIQNPDSHDVNSIENDINQLVYNLYDLTPQEIKLIEEEFSK